MASEIAAFRFSAYVSTVLNDCVDKFIEVLKINGNGSILKGYRLMHACHLGCMAQHPIKLPECMYKGFEKKRMNI